MTRSKRSNLLTFLTSLTSLTVAGFLLLAASNTARAAEEPVLVELFTSEGCSSCPPADSLLSKLAEDPSLVTVSEHVDYWNDLGWKDPFSKKQFSERQYDYARQMGKKGVYTPQAVIDGESEVNGSSFDHIMEAARKARSRSKTPIRVSIKIQGQEALVSAVTTTPVPASTTVLLIITESGLTSHVTRGENQAKVLKHTSVARYMESQNMADLTKSARPLNRIFKVILNPQWKKENLKAVVLVQNQERGWLCALGSENFK